ncbi:gamma-butyrobetaine hydroxylase-like domain-containing protein [Magnetococcales bacterium HHB-1]
MDTVSYGFDRFPTEIRQKQEAREVHISWDDGKNFVYTFESLRVCCPCAECRGHTPSERKLIYGQRDVTIEEISPIGHYAVKIVFSDGHKSGVYSWETLYDLGENQEKYWQEYLAELKEAGKSRVVFSIKAV